MWGHLSRLWSLYVFFSRSGEWMDLFNLFPRPQIWCVRRRQGLLTQALLASANSVKLSPMNLLQLSCHPPHAGPSTQRKYRVYSFVLKVYSFVWFLLLGWPHSSKRCIIKLHHQQVCSWYSQQLRCHDNPSQHLLL